MKNKKRFFPVKFSSIGVALIGVSVMAYGGIYINKNRSSSTIISQKKEIIIKDHKYLPDTIIIALNTTITWKNEDHMSHSVTSSTDLFDSHKINVGSSWSYEFTVADTFNYECKYHGEMTGVVIVK